MVVKEKRTNKTFLFYKKNKIIRIIIRIIIKEIKFKEKLNKMKIRYVWFYFNVTFLIFLRGSRIQVKLFIKEIKKIGNPGTSRSLFFSHYCCHSYRWKIENEAISLFLPSNRLVFFSESPWQLFWPSIVEKCTMNWNVLC